MALFSGSMMESFMPTKAHKNRSFVLSGPIAQDTPISTDSSLHHKERTSELPAKLQAVNSLSQTDPFQP